MCDRGGVTSTDDNTPAAVGTLASISVDCADPAVLADFYGGLLGMQRIYESGDGAVIALSAGGVCVTVMRIDDYVPPTWPKTDIAKQMHCDVSVTGLDASASRAVALGATVAATQPHPELFRVLLDPAGHPFCLTTATAG